jgi:hypothetical protein
VAGECFISRNLGAYGFAFETDALERQKLVGCTSTFGMDASPHHQALVVWWFGNE